MGAKQDRPGELVLCAQFRRETESREERIVDEGARGMRKKEKQKKGRKAPILLLQGSSKNVTFDTSAATRPPAVCSPHPLAARQSF